MIPGGLYHQIQGNLGVALGSLWGHFGVTLGSLWGHFGVTLGSLWDHFGVTLGSFWGHFGVILESFWDKFWPKGQQLYFFIAEQLKKQLSALNLLIVPKARFSQSGIGGGANCLIAFGD